jgi:hypothetical protein
LVWESAWVVLAAELDDDGWPNFGSTRSRRFDDEQRFIGGLRVHSCG